MTIRLRMFGVVEEVRQAFLPPPVIEVTGKYAAIVRLDVFNLKRSHFKEFTKKIIPIGRRVTGIGIGKGKTSMYINRGEDISF